MQNNAVALKNLWQEEQNTEILVTGCGSTYYLSLTVAALMQQTLGRRVRAVPASELLLFPATVIPPHSRSLLITISRSGTTTETILATEAYKAHQQGKVLYIGCYPESPLAQLSDLALAVPAGQEQSVAQTRSFSTMLVVAQAAIALLANKEQQSDILTSLWAYGEQLIATHHELVRQLGQNTQFERFYFLGSGPRYGLACEANLKMKEMSLSIAEAFHFLEFRHGPMSMVNDRTLIVGLLSNEARAYELPVLREMRKLGATTFALGEHAVPDQDVDYQVAFNSPSLEPYCLVFFLPMLQLLGYYHALLNKQNPDQPHNLSAVVILNGESQS